MAISWEEQKKRFLEVRRALNTSDTILAYNLCWKKPWKFYKEHTVEDAIKILLEETEEI